MKQAWIHKPITDILFILLPSFLTLAIVFIFQDAIKSIESKYSFLTWLFLIVFIDVAHVYATLFKTYFVRDTVIRNKKLLFSLPIISLICGIILYSFGNLFFWSILAYIAVFHFIRQQYGFMKMYARFEKKTKFSVFVDNLVIYNATLYPMFYWFLSPTRDFNWFVENEFLTFKNNFFLECCTNIYFIIITFYILYFIMRWFREKHFNLPKNLLFIGTYASWYFGIVYFNNDLIFSLLNVITHGIPYIALVYIKEIETKSINELGFLFYFKKAKGLLFFILIIFLIAFSEEYLWDILVWKEQFSHYFMDFSYLHFIIVPILTVPQLTHYLLDGFIWKSNFNPSKQQ